MSLPIFLITILLSIVVFLSIHIFLGQKHTMSPKRARRLARAAALETPPLTPPPTPFSPMPLPPAPIPQPTPPTTMALVPRKLLICSLGNPAPYRNTRHSAGHILAELLVATFSYPSFSADRAYGGFLSQPLYNTPCTFFQSPSLMNISGKPVHNAWARFQDELTPAERERAMLVVLHDELEKETGKIKVKLKGSHGGHNGVRSCMELIKGDFARIGVGIGRPESREVKAVTQHVLGKVLRWERECYELRTMPKLLQALEKLAMMP